MASTVNQRDRVSSMTCMFCVPEIAAGVRSRNSLVDDSELWLLHMCPCDASLLSVLMLNIIYIGIIMCDESP